MHSLADLVDKLIIENIKIFNLRDKLNQKDVNDEEYVRLFEKMMVLNENRSMLCNAVDAKLNNIVSKKESNEFLKKIRTYNDSK